MKVASARIPAALALGLLIAVSSPGCSRVRPLQMPPTSSFQALPRTEVESAIITGCGRRGWVPSRVGPSTIRATLHLRAHTAVVDIDYDDDSFTIRYADSTNLHYSRNADGTEQIHSNFNGWVGFLAHDITVELQKQSIVGKPLPPAGGAKP